MNKRGSNDPLWPMNRHPDQTFREDVSHSEKEIPSSYLGLRSPGHFLANVAICPLSFVRRRLRRMHDACVGRPLCCVWRFL